MQRGPGGPRARALQALEPPWRTAGPSCRELDAGIGVRHWSPATHARYVADVGLTRARLRFDALQAPVSISTSYGSKDRLGHCVATRVIVTRNGMGAGRRNAYNCMVFRAKRCT